MEKENLLLNVQNVTKEFGEGDRRVKVLRGVSLQLGRGQMMAIRGPSGAGKSTLLHLCGALDTPTSGKVMLEGRDLGAAPDDVLAGIRNERIGFVFQLHYLLPQCSVMENVLLPAIPSGVTNDVVSRAQQLLDRVGLGARSEHRPGELSGGERQRVSVVRALILRPCLLLADEPTGSLDSAAAESLMDLLVEINKEQGASLILVTHSDTAARRVGRSVELRDGLISGS